jgi:hypothetical protein
MLERENAFAEQACVINGVPDGGSVFIDSFVTTYSFFLLFFTISF